MQTVQDVEKHVPVREGDYGERVATVEPGGVEYIALKERHGKPIDLFWTWLSPNLEFATVFVGVLGVAVFGLSFWETALAILVGSLLGSATHYVLSSWGPKFGVPMMVESRGAFGFLGNILPAGLNAFTGTIGWFIVNSVSGAFALQALGGLINVNLPFAIAFLIIVVAQVAIATLGHNFIHVFERLALPLLGVVFALATIFIFSKANFGMGVNTHAPVFVGEFGSFTLLFTATFGYAAGWNPYAADYTRYLPPTTSKVRTGVFAALGVLLSCTVLELAGAASTSIVLDLDNPTGAFTQPLGTVVRDLTLLAIALGAVAANSVNIYSGALSFTAMGFRIPLRAARAVTALAFGVLGLVVAFIGLDNIQSYENFLLVISYWIGPWLGVYVPDWYLRRGHQVDGFLFDRRHRPFAGWV